MLDHTNSSVKVFGIGLSANVLGVLCGGVIGMAVTYAGLPGAEIAVIALCVVCVTLVLLPPLNRRLVLLLKSHTYIANKYKSTKNMYDAYYKRKENSRALNDWRTLFESYYKKNKDNPQLVLDMMRAEIDRYVNEYWTVAGTDWESWIDAYEKNGKLSKYLWPVKKDRENISAIHKSQLYEYLNSVFRTMCRNMYLDSLIEREKEYNKLADFYNTKFSIIIQEDKDKGEKSTWAGCYAHLAPLSSTADPSSWTGKLNSDGGGTITFTLLAHLKAGFPMTLEMYRTSADIKSGKKLKSVTLKSFSENTQTVVLEPRKVNQTEETEPASSEDTDSSTPTSVPPVTKEPVKEANPWYDATIVSLDNTNPKAFAGWYAVLEYPKDMHVELEDMLAMFDNTGKCILRFQKSDYEALESPSKIWLYQYKEDLLSKKKPDVIASFSLSGSYSGEYSGEPLYTILVKAKPKGNKDDILNSISGDYSSYMIRAELFIPGEGMMQIDKKEDYEPWEKPSAEVWLHYNGPSLTLKSYSDPYLTEYVLEKFSDTRYEITYQNGTTTVTHTVEIIDMQKSRVLRCMTNIPTTGSAVRPLTDLTSSAWCVILRTVKSGSFCARIYQGLAETTHWSHITRKFSSLIMMYALYVLRKVSTLLRETMR